MGSETAKWYVINNLCFPANLHSMTYSTTSTWSLFVSLWHLYLYPKQDHNYFLFLPRLKASIWCLQWPVKFHQSKLGGGVQDTFRDDQEGRCLLLSVDPQLLYSQCFLTDLWHATNIVHENDVLTVLKGSLNMFTYFAETPEECCAEWGEHAISQSPPSVSQDSVLRKNAWFKYRCN